MENYATFRWGRMDRKSGLIVLLALSFCIIWSSAFVAGKFALRSSPPLLLLSARFILAGGLMFIVAAGLRDSLRVSVLQFFKLLFLGLLNNAAYLGLSFYGLTMAPSGTVTIIAASTPLLTAALAGVLLSEQLGRRQQIGLLFGFLGVMFIAQRSLLLLPDVQPLGLICVALGTLALSLGTIAFKRMNFGMSLLAINAFQTLAGGLLLLPVALWLEPWRQIHLDLNLALSLTYLVIVVSVGAVLLWFKLLRLAEAGVASSFHFLNPAFGLWFAWWLLGEPVHWFQVGGIILVASGILLVLVGGGQTPASEVRVGQS